MHHLIVNCYIYFIEIPDVVKELIIERERYSMKSKSHPRKKGEREKSVNND